MREGYPPSSAAARIGTIQPTKAGVGGLDGLDQHISHLRPDRVRAERLGAGSVSASHWFKAEKRLLSASALAEQIEKKMIDIGQHLLPFALDEVGLIASLREAVRCLAEHTRIPCEFSWEGEGRLYPPNQTAVALFRITQELITVFASDSPGRKCSVHLALDGTHAHLWFLAGAEEIIPPGLRGMVRRVRSRVERLGGWLTLHAGWNGGAMITTTVPLPVRGPAKPIAR